MKSFDGELVVRNQQVTRQWLLGSMFANAVRSHRLFHSAGLILAGCDLHLEVVSIDPT